MIPLDQLLDRIQGQVAPAKVLLQAVVVPQPTRVVLGKTD